jgi:dTDP-4-amino-4,6-dideoxygalactose transaminase
VIVPSMTFVATANAVRYCGATPVFADIVGPDDLGLDPDDVGELITPRTKAIAVVHYGGYAADVEAIAAICRAHGLALVEDAAHSPCTAAGSSGRPAGTWGTLAAFSFFSNKVLGCGEGGLVTTDDDDLAAFLRSRRSHAMTSTTWDRHQGHASSYDVVGLGFNYRMDEPRAALLLARLERLDEDVRARRAIVRRYREALAGLPGISVPYADADVGRSSCYVMPAVVEDASMRDPLRAWLHDRGVQTSVLYPAVHEFTAYRSHGQRPLPRTELVARSEITLPLYPHLSERDLEHVVAGLRAGLETVRPGLAVR